MIKETLVDFVFIRKNEFIFSDEKIVLSEYPKPSYWQVRNKGLDYTR